MAVMACVAYDEVFKFKETGMIALIREACDYLNNAEAKGAVVEEIKFVETDSLYLFRITYKKGYSFYGPDSA